MAKTLIMNLKLCIVHAQLILLGLVIFHSNVSCSQGNPGQNWEEFSPSIGGFTIQFPKLPSESAGTINVGKMIVKTHTYTARDDNAYTVMYCDVPHLDDPKVRGDLLLGFRNFVLAEFRADLLSDNPISIGNNAGRLLEMSVSKRGIARAIILVTDFRLYRIAVVPEKRATSDENAKATSTRFFESFKLSTIDTSEEGEVDAYLRTNPDLAQRAIAADSSNNVLNGKALSLPFPEYPLLARGIHASGTVIVKVIIDEEGRVMGAQAIGGHPLLQSAAVAAARKARFSPTSEQGKPVRVLGKVTYNFISQ